MTASGWLDLLSCNSPAAEDHVAMMYAQLMLVNPHASFPAANLHKQALHNRQGNTSCALTFLQGK